MIRSSSILAAAVGAGLAIPALAQEVQTDPYANLPASLELTGVVRDFKEKSVPGGHPDMERQPTAGFGHYTYIADGLDDDGKPVWASSGRKVTTQWRDSAGRNIIPPRPHMPMQPGDLAGVKQTTDGGACSGADGFAGWWRDNPAYNVSMPLSINLVRTPGTNQFVFDDRTDPAYSSKGGFFPIDGNLFGNSGGSPHNFHFSFELETEFMYKHGTGQVFTFRGDDDVFVFIDGKVVIDLGGVHSAVQQTVNLDRLSWLQDGKKYQLKFFFTERHWTQSNFRIETNLELRNVELPATAGLYD
jgi:fibro-slime domain-containing protein